MAESKTTIANMSAHHLGIGREISNINTEKTHFARSWRRFHDIALRDQLREHDWGFARKWRDLALIEENPVKGWLYSYSYPSDCIEFRKIWNGARNEARASQIPWVRAHGSSGQVIYTDQPTAVGIYTVFVDDYGIFPSDFLLALSWRQAYYTAAHVTKGDPFDFREVARGEWMQSIRKAIASDENENHHDVRPDSEFITTRMES